MFQISDTRKIGTLLVCLGLFFLFLGVTLLFDSRLLAMGNILFLAGFTFLSGVLTTLKFFGLYGSTMLERWKKRWPGLITFMGGIMLVLSGWSVVGMLVELFGFINLFGSFFPLAFSFLKTLPVIGNVLSMPLVTNFVDRLSGKTSSSMV